MFKKNNLPLITFQIKQDGQPAQIKIQNNEIREWFRQNLQPIHPNDGYKRWIEEFDNNKTLHIIFEGTKLRTDKLNKNLELQNPLRKLIPAAFYQVFSRRLFYPFGFLDEFYNFYQTDQELYKSIQCESTGDQLKFNTEMLLFKKSSYPEAKTEMDVFFKKNNLSKEDKEATKKFLTATRFFWRSVTATYTFEKCELTKLELTVFPDFYHELQIRFRTHALESFMRKIKQFINETHDQQHIDDLNKLLNTMKKIFQQSFTEINSDAQIRAWDSKANQAINRCIRSLTIHRSMIRRLWDLLKSYFIPNFNSAAKIQIATTETLVSLSSNGR